MARLEQIFEALGESPKGKQCKGMEGLVAEGAEMIEEDLVPAELDAGLISAAQRVEHYEIAAYGCVCAYAKLLQEDHASSLLRKTLEEEKKTNEKLTELSDKINVEAAEANESNSTKRPDSTASKAKAQQA